MINPAIRQLQIALIADAPNEISDFFYAVWNGVDMITVDILSPLYNEFVFYKVIDGKHTALAYLNTSSKLVWYDDTRIARPMANKFRLLFPEVDRVVSILMEHTLDVVIDTIDRDFRIKTQVAKKMKYLDEIKYEK